jgi:hypothetical protein
MNPILQRPWLWLIIIALCVGGCTRIFENHQDVQAQQALQDLMAIQDQFHKENTRYAKNLVEIDKYNLKYHKGIVYLEIEKAGKGHYRAISLPAESTTARVFAYDTSRGGYYEMDEEEVAQYVLGALRSVFSGLASVCLPDTRNQERAGCGGLIFCAWRPSAWPWPRSTTWTRRFLSPPNY